MLLPTAVQSLADVHETPFRVAAGSGVPWIAQVEPFQVSVNGAGAFGSGS
jgi:hypothetical protein